jgi:hypothetical protein
MLLVFIPGTANRSRSKRGPPESSSRYSNRPQNRRRTSSSRCDTSQSQSQSQSRSRSRSPLSTQVVDIDDHAMGETGETGNRHNTSAQESEEMEVDKDTAEDPPAPPSAQEPVMLDAPIKPSDRINTQRKPKPKPRVIPTDEEPSSPGKSLFLSLSRSIPQSLPSSFPFPLQMTATITHCPRALFRLSKHSTVCIIVLSYHRPPSPLSHTLVLVATLHSFPFHIIAFLHPY